MLKRLRRNRAFTLVELMIVVAIVGLLAALAIYGVRKYMANAKTTEARNSLGAIVKGAQAAWNGDSLEATVLTIRTETTSVADRLCPDGPQVPTNVPAGEKYQSSVADWTGGWDCLKFQMDGPQYYAYRYTVDGTNGFTAFAFGDLDGDSTLSTFSMAGSVDRSVAGSVTLAVSTKANETLPDE